MGSSFRDQLNGAYKTKVEGTLEKTVRMTGLTTYTELVMNTPVLTGRAKSNWWPDINSVSVALRDVGQDPAGAAVIMQQYKLNDVIYISNNLPYIRRLNEGYSKQAPANFVEASVQVAAAKAQEHARSL